MNLASVVKFTQRLKTMENLCCHQVLYGWGDMNLLPSIYYSSPVANYSKVRVPGTIQLQLLVFFCYTIPLGMIDVALEICPYQFGIFYDLKCFLSS